MKEVKVSFAEKKAWLTVDEKVADKALEEAVAKPGSYTGRVVARTPVP